MRFSNKQDLTEGKISSKLLNLTLPMVFGMFSMVLFNLIDTYFVGKLGIKELAALGFTFPIVLVVASLSLGLGMGASAVISKAVGEGNHHEVQEFTSYSLLLSFLLGILIAFLGFFTVSFLFKLMGAKGVVFLHVKDYMNIWYWGVVFVALPMVGNHAIRASGDTFSPAFIMMVGAGLNIILDWLLIFGIGPFPYLGLKGAALATLIARAFTALVSFCILYYGKDMITFKLSSLEKLVFSWKRILYIGIPTAFTRVMRPVTLGIITAMLASYGDEPVAAFGVSSRIEFFAVSVVIALASVIAPFVGQNLGADRLDRIKKAVGYGKKFSLVWGGALFVFLLFFADPIACVFNDSKQVVSYIAIYLKLVAVGYGFFGVLIVASSALNVLHKPFLAALLVLTQMFIFCIPLAYLGSRFFGVSGVFGGISVSYLFSGFIAHIVFNKVLSGTKKSDFEI